MTVIQTLTGLVRKLFPVPKKTVLHGEAPRVPYGVRVYAIGDIHGRADLLDEIFAGIEADELERPIACSIIVLLGDYIDRGLRSKEVLDRLIERTRRRHVVALRGNHDDYMWRALSDDNLALRWLACGGRETLYAYGIIVPVDVNRDNVHIMMAKAAALIPDRHKAFLERLLLSVTIGDYAFVHAGIRPGIAMVDQSSSDLMSIRQPFLDCTLRHEFVIVHGHTPVNAPDFRRNRINIDTGAYLTGNLTCLILEEDRQLILK